MMRLHTQKSVFALALIISAPCSFAITLDEAAVGDFSGDRLNPTPWLLSYSPATPPHANAGQNILAGTTGRTGSTVDREYVAVTVPEGYMWTELRVGNQTTVGGSQGSFIGLAAGPIIPIEPSASTAAGLLGWKVYGVADRATDILDDMAAAGQGASGFTRPLGPGQYSLWIQELATGSFTFRFNAVLSPIPEPGMWLSMTLGLLGIGALRRLQTSGASSRNCNPRCLQYPRPQLRHPPPA
jgi:hypothetical protein